MFKDPKNSPLSVCSRTFLLYILSIFICYDSIRIMNNIIKQYQVLSAQSRTRVVVVPVQLLQQQLSSRLVLRKSQVSVFWGYKKQSHYCSYQCVHLYTLIFVWPTTSTTICCCFSTTTQQQTYSLAYALEIFQSINEQG